ncbi:uncharacterized protein LOC142346050 isoform X2 [Convolutriloba macropyga]|uniref:uncharacterized protein LOC142346050 isoform X2 n=1 Tax=Convolutriloba macropyga TaxID=536237 RepID=UPI003F5205F9
MKHTEMAETESHDLDEETKELLTNLSEAPVYLLTFCGLLSLFGENQVTGSDVTTETFLRVRDLVRQQAIVYAAKVLPMTEKLMLKISQFLDYFLDLDYSTWADILDTVVEDLDELVKFCGIVIELHKDIISKLHENEREAELGVKLMGELEAFYREESEKLKKEARQCKKDASGHRDFRKLFAVATCGISYLYSSHQAAGCERNAAKNTAMAIAKQENADIAGTAVLLTVQYLIPAIQDFITSLNICCAYFSKTKFKLAKARETGDKDKKEAYFKIMRARALEISKLSEDYVVFLPLAVSYLGAIPEEPDDKNYVDKWLAEQIKKIEEKNAQETSFMSMVLKNFSS